MKTRVSAVLAMTAIALGLSATSAHAGLVPSAKRTNGWNTLNVVADSARTYCVQMKTVAKVDLTSDLATAKAKVRVLKTKNTFCDKRVHNLNLGSTVHVAFDGDGQCDDESTSTVVVSQTKLLKAVATDLLSTGCAAGFIVDAETTMKVGKAKHGGPVPTSPATLPQTPEGPVFPPLP